MRAILVALLLVGGAAHAQGVSSYHAGNTTCGNYLEYRQKSFANAQDEIVSWTFGFFTGMNFQATKPITVEAPDKATVLAYLDKHCRDNPLDRVVRASLFMYRDLGGVPR